MGIWTLIKDILLTGTGIALILSQMLSKTPNDAMLVTGLALTVPTLADHAKAVISGPSASRESTRPGEPPSVPSSSSSGSSPD